MTPAEQKAWIAGRDAAADLIARAAAAIDADEDNALTWGGPDPRGPAAATIHRGFARTLHQHANAIRALPPPAVTAWTPPPEAERPDGFRCLGWAMDDWEMLEWSLGEWRASWGYVYSPIEHFRPLPAAPLPGVQDE